MHEMAFGIVQAAQCKPKAQKRLVYETILTGQSIAGGLWRAEQLPHVIVVRQIARARYGPAVVR